MALSSLSIRVHALASFLFLLVAHVQAQTAAWTCPGPSSKAINSTANPTLKLGSVRTLRWHTTRPNAKIELFQDNGQTVNGGAIKWLPIVTINDIQGETGEFNWTVNADNYDLTRSQIFYLGLTISSGDKSEPLVTSQYFNITADDTNPICAPPSATPTSSLVLSSTPSATGLSQSSNPSPSNPAQSNSSSLSSGAIACISVGCTLVGIALLGALGWWLLRRRKQVATPVLPEYSDSNPAEKYGYHAEADGQTPRVEADSGVQVQQLGTKDGARYELGG